MSEMRDPNQEQTKEQAQRAYLDALADEIDEYLASRYPGGRLTDEMMTPFVAPEKQGDRPMSARSKDLSYLPEWDLRDAIRGRMDAIQQLREHLADKEERLRPYLFEYSRRFGHEYGSEPEPDEPLPEEWACFDRLSGERFTVLATDEGLRAKVEHYIRAGLDADSGAVAYEVDCRGSVTSSGVFLSGEVVWA